MDELTQNKGIEKSADVESDAFSSGQYSPQEKKLRDPQGRNALFAYTVCALGLALFIRFFVAAPYIVSGSSMEPSFYNWDYLITDRLSFRFIEPSRGDVIVFHLPQEYSRTLIKRVVGLPGETVEIDGANIKITAAEHTDSFYLDESYLDHVNLGGPTDMKVTLSNNEYFVMGDNRRVSSDSRSWGTLPKDHIVGRVLLRLFPFSRIDILPAKARYLLKE